MASLLTAKQDQALRNLLQGLIAKEVADKLHAARELVALMNDASTPSRPRTASASRCGGADATTSTTVSAGPSACWPSRPICAPQTRTARSPARCPNASPTPATRSRAPYRELIAEVLDYRSVAPACRSSCVGPGRTDERLSRRTALSEGEKKMVSYLPLFAAVAASCDALAEPRPDAPRFVLLDDAFAKVSEDNHPKLFGLLVELDLDFIATSERLWGTHATVPELAITEVIRDADLGVIVLEHARWDGHTRQYSHERHGAIPTAPTRQASPSASGKKLAGDSSATSLATSGATTGRSWPCSPARSSPSSRLMTWRRTSRRSMATTIRR